MFVQHVAVVNVGPPVTFEVSKDGRLRVMDTGSTSLFPSHRPFFSRRKRDESGSAHVILVALDPEFVGGRTAASLGIDPAGVELVERRTGNDSMLRHTVMALHSGLRAGRTSDQMYPEALSTALAVHLMREYSGTVHPQPTSGRLSRETLMRAFEYIHDQLEANLTVSGIARAVHMSPYHFTRLFKQSTGLSPYRYVIQARVKKAKELLTSSKFSIIEIAHRLGFADQSHLTRHFKNLCGVTPKKFQEREGPGAGFFKKSQKHSRASLA